MNSNSHPHVQKLFTITIDVIQQRWKDVVSVCVNYNDSHNDTFRYMHCEMTVAH